MSNEFVNEEQFDEWLRKGLGRAAVFLKSHDSRLYRQVLLHACTHLLAYDPQCEDPRAPYLLDLIEVAGDQQYYRDGLLAALNSGDEELYRSQIFSVAAGFAAKGDSEIKEVMYRTFDRLGFDECGVTCAEELVNLDGAPALVFVAKTLGTVKDERPWQFGILMEALERRDGKQPPPADVAEFVREWQDFEEHLEREWQKRITPRPDYLSFKKSLSANGATWARDANDEELQMAAQDLVVETDPVRLLNYLLMFRFRAFPGPIEIVLDLARSEDSRIARTALTVLKHMTDPRIRALALDLINDATWRGWTPGLLVRNAQEGDLRILENLLEDSSDPDVLHKMGFGVQDFVEAHQSPEGARSLLLVYEKDPCSMCRRGAVQGLVAIDCLPGWMLEECRYDACSDTRELWKELSNR